jgi:hypothetical protein
MGKDDNNGIITVRRESRGEGDGRGRGVPGKILVVGVCAADRTHKIIEFGIAQLGEVGPALLGKKQKYVLVERGRMPRTSSQEAEARRNQN